LQFVTFAGIQLQSFNTTFK